MKYSNIIDAIKEYARSGSIDDTLICCYDQHGQWRGDSILTVISVSSDVIKKIRSSHLPEHRRTATNESGTILLTSFLWSGKFPAMIPYNEIKGNVIIDDQAAVRANHLRHVGGHFISNDSERVYVPHLRSVGGNFVHMRGYGLMAPRLSDVGGDMLVADYIPSRLTSVGGRLGAFRILHFDTPQLKRVGGALVASDAREVFAPLLESVGGGFLLGKRTRNVHVPFLRTVGGDFLAGTAITVNMPRLRKVGGDMETKRARGCYDPSIQVSGKWTYHENDEEYWIQKVAARRKLWGNPDGTYI